jgi:hypothetical protein
VRGRRAKRATWFCRVSDACLLVVNARALAIRGRAARVSTPLRRTHSAKRSGVITLMTGWQAQDNGNRSQRRGRKGARRMRQSPWRLPAASCTRATLRTYRARLVQCRRLAAPPFRCGVPGTRRRGALRRRTSCKCPNAALEGPRFVRLRTSCSRHYFTPDFVLGDHASPRIAFQIG